MGNSITVAAAASTNPFASTRNNKTAVLLPMMSVYHDHEYKSCLGIM